MASKKKKNKKTLTKNISIKHDKSNACPMSDKDCIKYIPRVCLSDISKSSYAILDGYNEYNDLLSFLEDKLNKNNTLDDGTKISEVLGLTTFELLEKQITDTTLEVLRAKRKLLLLNKLYDSAMKLINDNLVDILSRKEEYSSKKKDVK